MRQLITPKSVIAATVVASVVAASAIGAVGYQSYAKVQVEALEQFDSAQSQVVTEISALDSLVSSAQEQITAGQSLLDASAGKTLDNVARDALSEAIVDASAAIEQAQTRADALKGDIRQVADVIDEQLLWPPTALESAEQLQQSVTSLTEDLESALEKIAKHSQAVTEAQAAWQAEQDRIAAEAAAEAARKAAEAAARRAAAGGDRPLSPSGGSTQPVPQAAPPPPPATTPTALLSFAESFLRQYVSPSQASIAWDPTLCAPGYICGTTTVGVGTPLITLMGTDTAPANYDFGGGRYVLVHEAAHARQYWLYGSVSGMINGLLPFAPPAPAGWPSGQGIWAVEYMADCSTQAQLGTTGTYMRMVGVASCTPEQLREASRVW